MARFRKKPIEVDAERFDPANGYVPDSVWRDDAGQYWVTTLNGPVRVQAMSWIVTGVQGEKYPVKPDIFKATYERVERRS